MDHASIPMQQQQRHVNGGEGRSGGAGGGGGGGAAGNVSSACRPSGTRWTPTSEQIRILRELYYGCGIRSPNAEQIQRIAARLRQYGRIEGKNVFYWFQNHKARERQKKRLTTLDVNTSTAADGSHLAASVLSLSPSDAAAAASSADMYAVNGSTAAQQEASTNCWDSTAMATDRSFMQLQDYMGVRTTGGQHHGGAGGATPWACFPFTADQTPMTTTTATREPETLPLFPTGGRHGGPGEGGHGHQESIVHGRYLQSNNFQCWGAAATTITAQQRHQLLQQLQEQHSFYSSSNQLPSQDAAGGGGTSLELTLSSYCSPYPAGSM